jgi:ABC-2 type transport system ATP-binding protein
MDEAEYCDRIAIIDHGNVVALGTPDDLKAKVAKDRIQLRTADDEAATNALRDRFGLEAARRDGLLTIAVDQGEQFVPRLFAELGVPIYSISVARPSLDDVFLAYTGTTIRDAEASASEKAGMTRIARARRG